MRYKEVRAVFWRTGCRKRALRLLVIAPIPYRVPGRRRKGYRDPAYLLTTDVHGTARELLQAYSDRWQIEVNHREEKDTLGVGQAQLRSPRSVPRQPAFVVAAYSALLLAGLLAYGVIRDTHHTVTEVAQQRRSPFMSRSDRLITQGNDRKRHPARALRPETRLENSRVGRSRLIYMSKVQGVA